MNLKPETPLIKKLEIKRLEDECENLRLWRWRLTIAIELILITVLGACVINFYLNWAKCIELLRQNGATEVYWEPIPDPQTGSSLRKTDIEFKDKNNNTNRCYETRIKVVIDDKEYEMQTPVMNGANPVKDNSMSQQRVWNSMCRAFVKCVAIHTGLGFNLWLGEEYNKLEAKIPGTGENLASEAKKKTLKTQCTAHGIDLDA